MTDLLQRLAEIRELQGREPISPTSLGPPPLGSEPPDPLPPSEARLPGFEPSEPDPYGLDQEPEPEPEPALARPERRATIPTPSPAPAAPDLCIVGLDASGYVADYRGRRVELLPLEQAAVRRLVLRALAREIKQQLAQVERLLPQRRRRLRGETPKELPGSGPQVVTDPASDNVVAVVGRKRRTRRK